MTSDALLAQALEGGVRGPVLMELELIEPDLFLMVDPRGHPCSPRRS